MPQATAASAFIPRIPEADASARLSTCSARTIRHASASRTRGSVIRTCAVPAELSEFLRLRTLCSHSLCFGSSTAPLSSFSSDPNKTTCCNVSLQRGRGKKTLIKPTTWGNGLFMGEPVRAGDFIVGELSPPPTISPIRPSDLSPDLDAPRRIRRRARLSRGGWSTRVSLTLDQTYSLSHQLISLLRPDRKIYEQIQRNYVFDLNASLCIDAFSKGNAARFINHPEGSTDAERAENSNCHPKGECPLKRPKADEGRRADPYPSLAVLHVLGEHRIGIYASTYYYQELTFTFLSQLTSCSTAAEEAIPAGREVRPLVPSVLCTRF